jgi:ACS family tartrate transporter-like MFS transporter
MSATAILPDVGQRATRKISRRLLPFLFVLYVIAFLDRVNVGYAGLEMSRDLHFSDRVFGFGAGIFSIGYFLFEIPGALIVERWSARKWIARILVTWGLVTILMAAVHTPHQFYAARFLLGVAEAGFFPGIVVYLTHWFRYEDRAKAGAIFMAAIPMSSIIGSPLAGWILSQHWAEIASWRWLFIAEGVPAMLFGFLTLLYLTDWPRQAAWLREDERTWIEAKLAGEKAAKLKVREWSIWQAIRSRQVILLTLIYFFAIIGIYGFVIWFPTIVQRATNLPNMAVTLLSALPYVAGLAAMIWNGWHSDRTGERRWHTAFPLFLGAGCLGIAIRTSAHLPLAFLCMIVVGACTTAFMPSFWALPTAILSESAAAASIGLINSVANLGGVCGTVFDRLFAHRYKFVYARPDFSAGLHGNFGLVGIAAPCWTSNSTH